MGILENLQERFGLRQSKAQLIKPPDMDSIYVFDGTNVNRVSLNGQSSSGYTGMLPTVLQFQRNTYGQTKEDYAIASALNPYISNAVMQLSSDVSDIEYGVRNSQNVDIENHRFMRAIADNRRLRQQDAIKYLVRSLLIFGEAYMRPLPHIMGGYTGVQLFNPIAVDPIIIGGRIHAYHYNGDAGLEQYTPGQIFYFRLDNMLDDSRGLSPMASIMTAANIYRQVDRYTLDQLLRDLKLSGILTARQGASINPTTLKTALDEIKKNLGSRFIALSGQLEFNVVQQEYDTSTLELADHLKKQIAVGFRIPLSIAGAWDTATYQSSPEQKRFYLEQVVGRYCEDIATWMNDVVMPAFGGGEFYFDVQSAIKTTFDQKLITEIAAQQFETGGSTYNEYRQEIGKPKIEGGDFILINGNIITLEKRADGSFGIPQGALPEPAPIPPPAPAPTPVMAIEPPRGVGDSKTEFWVGLSLAGNLDLLIEQTKLRQLFLDQAIKWTEPDDYHLTLLFAPIATPEQVEAFRLAIAQETIDPIRLKLGTIATFDDSANQYPIHFRIRSNGDLKDLQSALYDMAVACGIAFPSYSQPQNWQPHITIGYGSERVRMKPYTSRYTIQPDVLSVDYGHEPVYTFGFNTPHPEPVTTVGEQPEAPAPLTVQPPAKSADRDWRELALPYYKPYNPVKELQAWRKKVKNRGTSAVDFVCHQVSEEVAEALRITLKAATTPQDIEAAFDLAIASQTKAIQATRIDFEDALADLLTEITGGGINKRRARNAFMNLIQVHGNKAARDGFEDAGVTEEPDAEEQADIDNAIRAQRQYVNALLDKLYSDEDTISDAMREQKPAMWFNKSIYPIYVLALGLADANGMYEWVYGDTEHCDDCKRLNGQRHRMKDWTRRGLLPKSSDLECKGFQCKCNLVRTRKRAYGSY